MCVALRSYPIIIRRRLMEAVRVHSWTGIEGRASCNTPSPPSPDGLRHIGACRRAYRPARQRLEAMSEGCKSAREVPIRGDLTFGHRIGPAGSQKIDRRRQPHVTPALD